MNIDPENNNFRVETNLPTPIKKPGSVNLLEGKFHSSTIFHGEIASFGGEIAHLEAKLPRKKAETPLS